MVVMKIFVFSDFYFKLLPLHVCTCTCTCRCHAACEEWGEVLELLGPAEAPLPKESPPASSLLPDVHIPSLSNINSAALVLMAAAHEGLGDLPSAIQCYKQALTEDVCCIEALDKLCLYHALTGEEEKALFKSLPFQKQCSMEEEKALTLLYQQKLKHTAPNAKTDALSEFQAHKSLQPLCSNLDVLCNIAEHHFRTMNIDACYKLTTDIVEKDPYHHSALLLHLACCVQKGKTEELFSLGHRLVDYFPNSALAWYSVACYYIAVNKHQSARKYLTKAVSLDSQFAAAHMAFGLSFTNEGEHDQAISAFSNAARIMQGSHLPLLYLGREYCQTGSVSTAVRFLCSARAIAPHDPVLLQEMGTIIASAEEYPKAERYFRSAITQLSMIDPQVTLQLWETVYNNLGHVLRKQGKLDEALSMHFSALHLEPAQSSTLTAIGFVYLLKGDFENVVKFANQALRLKREDQFTLELLQTAMEEMSEQPTVIQTPIPNLESDIDELEPGTGSNSILKVEENMILGPQAKRKRESSEDSSMTID